MADRVYTVIQVKCNCNHPIVGAPVKVVIQNNVGSTDKILTGTTDSGGMYIDGYERTGTLALLQSFSGTVMACNGKTLWPSDQNVQFQINVNAVLTRMLNAAALGGRPMPTFSNIKSIVQARYTLTSQNLSSWLLVKVITVNCHTTCTPTTTTTHSVAPPATEARSGYSISVGGPTVTGIIGWRKQNYTYTITNTGTANITDYKICFEPNNGQLPTATGMPAGWTSRVVGDCIVFETTGTGIPPTGTGAFVISVPNGRNQGLVKVNVSYPGPAAPGGTPTHTDGTDPTDTLGPLAFALPSEETGLISGTVLVTGDLYASLDDDITRLLQSKGFDILKMKGDAAPYTTLISKTKIPPITETNIELESNFNQEKPKKSKRKKKSKNTN